MLVSELFRDLSYGELSNLPHSGEGSGELLEAHHGKFLSFTNRALERLTTRFKLFEDSVLLEQSAWIRHYKLNYDHALSNPDRPANVTPYIQDSVHKPFTNNVVKVLSVNGLGGHHVPLNDAENPNSVFTPRPDTIQIPSPVTGRLLGIVYQAKHPVVNGLGDLIDIPGSMLEALKAYIAYLTYSGINTQESTAKATEHLTIYEALCGEATQMSLVESGSHQTNLRFDKGGWV